MNILPLLFRRQSPSPRPRRPPVDEPPGDEEDRPLGCGWFDSSHDLECGLVVREHAGLAPPAYFGAT